MIPTARVGIQDWNRLQQDQKTLDNFQTHFSNEYRTLRESGKLDSQHSSFNTTNIIQELVNGVQTALNPTDNNVEETTQLIHQANIAAAATDQQTILMQQILQMMQNMQTQLMTTAPPQLHSSRSNGTNNPRRRHTTTKYCWSHGACAHDSNECTNKKPGHVNGATFQDRKGASTNYVQNT